MENLTERSFESLYESVEKLNSFLESVEFGSDSYNDKEFIKRDFGFAISEKAKNGMEHTMNLKDSGVITESYCNELCADLLEKYNYGVSTAMPYYMEGAVGNSLSTILNEIAAYASKIFVLVPKSAVGDILTLPVKKFVLQRLKRYPLLYEDAVEFKQLRAEKYTIAEMKNKFKIKTDFAEKWQQSGKRTDCKLYSYNNKPVMCIFYTKVPSASTITSPVNVETVIMDSKFKKHEDYYVACMATSLQLSHPAAGRVLKKMKDRWNTELKRQKTEIKESVEDSIIEGTFDRKLHYIEEAVQFKVMDREVADNYLSVIDRVQFKDM